MKSNPPALLFLGLLAISTATAAEAPATQPAATKPALPFTLGKETTAITSPLHDDGTPDYVAAFNEQFGKGVTSQNNAFVGWLKIVGPVLPPTEQEKVLTLCGVKESDFIPDMMLHTLFSLDDAEKEKWMTQHLWEPGDNPKEIDFLKAEEKTLDAAKEAFAREKFWVPYVFTKQPFFCEGLFMSAKYEELTNHLLARATLRAKGGDFQGFVSDIIAVKHMALHVASSAMLYDRQSGYAMSRNADRAIGAALGEGVCSADQCKSLATELDALTSIPPLNDAMQCQRWMLLDSVIRLAMNKNPTMAMGDWKTLERESIEWDGVLKRINASHDELLNAIAKTKLEDMEKSVSALQKRGEPNQGNYSRKIDEARDGYSARVADLITTPFWGGVAGMEEVRREAVMQNQLARVVVAAAQFHADKNKWPDKLEELAPSYLKEIPRDLFSDGGDQPIEYSVLANGIIVKSVGIKIGGKPGAYLRKTIEVGAN